MLVQRLFNEPTPRAVPGAVLCASLLACGCSAGEGGISSSPTARPPSTTAPVAAASAQGSAGPAAPPVLEPTAAPAQEPRSHLVPGIQNATQVAVTMNRTCVLRGTGEVICWDSPPSGSTGAVKAAAPPALLPMAGIQDVIDLTAFEDHTCALKSTGKVACWGTRVPWPGKGAQESIPSPREVPGLTEVMAIATHLAHTCALRRSGTIACFGEDAFSRLGDPKAKDPKELVTVRGIGQATAVAVSNFGGCAIHDRGALSCWGAGSITAWAPYKPGYSPSASLDATRLKGLSDVAAVGLYDLRACVLLRAGQARCWGTESLTMLPDNPLPETSAVANLGDAVSVGGELIVRGNGTLVAVEADEQSRYTARPVLPEITGAVRVDGDSNRGCAVLANGRLACWGD